MTHHFQPAQDFCAPVIPPDRVLAFYQNRLLIKKSSNGMAIPQYRELASMDWAVGTRLYLGKRSNAVYSGWAFQEEPALPDDLELAGLRSLFGRMEDTEFQIAGYAMQLLNWVAENRCCGRCGNAMTFEDGERALTCTACRQTLYPRISPAVIVAITSGNRLLLARSGRFPGQRMFSVIAGYVEPGETLEACVQREIREEVGLSVANIRYFGSQSWPFSGSLMVGFTAEHAGGEIRVDGKEILEADWFAPDRLPEIPGKISIARQLIDWFIDQYG